MRPRVEKSRLVGFASSLILYSRTCVKRISQVTAFNTGIHFSMTTFFDFFSVNVRDAVSSEILTKN